MSLAMLLGVWGEGNWGTDLPAGCILAAVLSEHTLTVAGGVAGFVGRG